MVEIIHADRDAVFTWQNASNHAPNKLAEAFAHHRIAALATAEERIRAQDAEIARLRGALTKIADDLGEQFLLWVEDGCEGKDAIRLVCNVSQEARRAALTGDA